MTWDRAERKEVMIGMSGSAKQIPATGQRVGDRLQCILDVNKEDRQIVCEVVAKGDGHDRDRKDAENPGSGTTDVGKNFCYRQDRHIRNCQGGEDAEQSCCIRDHQRGPPWILQWILSDQRHPKERLGQPIERDR